MIERFDYHHEKDAVHAAILRSQPCVIKNLLCYKGFNTPESSTGDLIPTLHWVFCQFEDSGLYPHSFLDTIRALPGLANLKTRIWSNDGLHPLTPLHWEGGARTFLNTQVTGSKRWMLIDGKTRAIEHCVRTNGALLLWGIDLEPRDVNIVDIHPDETILCPMGWYHAVQFVKGDQDSGLTINIDLQYTCHSDLSRDRLPINFDSRDLSQGGNHIEKPMPSWRTWLSKIELGLIRKLLLIALIIRYRRLKPQLMRHLDTDAQRTYEEFLSAIENKQK